MIACYLEMLVLVIPINLYMCLCVWYKYGCSVDKHVLMSVELFDFIVGHAVSMAFLQSYIDVAIKLKGIIQEYSYLFFWSKYETFCKTV